MKTKTLVGLALAGIAVFMIMNAGSGTPATTNTPPRNPQEPPRPPVGAAISQVQAWVVALMSLYGSAEWLWQPGGPLYGRSRNQDQQLLNEGADYNSGWA